MVEAITPDRDLARLDAALSQPRPDRLPPPLPKASLVVEGPATGASSGIGFALAAGDVLAVAGPSGAGTITLLRVLARIKAPLAGPIRLDDVACGHHAPE